MRRCYARMSTSGGSGGFPAARYAPATSSGRGLAGQPACPYRGPSSWRRRRTPSTCPATRRGAGVETACLAGSVSNLSIPYRTISPFRGLCQPSNE